LITFEDSIFNDVLKKTLARGTPECRKWLGTTGSSYSLGKLFTVSHQRWIFQACGSNATDLLMLLFTQYETIRGLPLSAVSLSRCITCQDVCVQQSHAGLPFSASEYTKIAHQRNPYSYNKNP